MNGSAVDLRSFIYPLAAQLDKHCWELERLQSEAAKAGLRLRQLDLQKKGIEDSSREQLACLTGCVRNRPDPVMHGRALDYLVSLRKRLQVMEEEMQAARVQQRKLQERCIALQRRIQMFEEHRAAQLQDYVVAAQTRLASELDREWSARSLWRGVKASSAELS